MMNDERNLKSTESSERVACWRLIEDGAGDALPNMARDEALFEAVAANEAPPTLRLYEWDRPSVSIGRFQNVDRTVNAANCERFGVPIARRITGGRGILHGHDLTISAAGIVEPGLNANTLAIYYWLAQGFIAAFHALDVPAQIGACSIKRPQETQGDCFSCISQADVVHAVSGRKLLGAALHLRQNARQNVFLLQASIPLFCEDAAIVPSLVPADVFLGQGSQTDAAMRGISTAAMRQAIRFGLTSALNFSFDLPSEP